MLLFRGRSFMQAFGHIVALTAPLFLLVLLGYSFTRWGAWLVAASLVISTALASVTTPLILAPTASLR
jgi:predicted permease